MSEGIIRGLSFAEYEQIDAVNASKMKLIKDSPLAYKRAVEGARKAPSASMSLGSAVHAAILEPELYAASWAVWTGGRRGTNAHKEFEQANEGKTIITKTEADTVEIMRDRVLSHPRAAEVMARAEHEITMVWTDRTTGLRCKGRVDILSHVIADLKTTRAPSPREFSRQASQLGYHLSMAHYEDGIKTICGDSLPVYMIAVGNSPPHDVYIYQISEDDLRRASAQRGRYMDTLRACIESDTWEDPSMVVHALGVHAWAFDEPEEEITTDGEPLEFGEEEF